MNGQAGKERTYHLAGWGLFVVCALLFLASGLINGDIYTISGSLVFLLACVIFLLPLISRPDKNS